MPHTAHRRHNTFTHHLHSTCPHSSTGYTVISYHCKSSPQYFQRSQAFSILHIRRPLPQSVNLTTNRHQNIFTHHLLISAHIQPPVLQLAPTIAHCHQTFVNHHRLFSTKIQQPVPQLVRTSFNGKPKIIRNLQPFSHTH